MTPQAEDLDRFRECLARRLGLNFGPEKQEYLSDALRQGMLEGGHAAAPDFFAALDQAASREMERLVQALTVGETYFFRQWDHYRALLENALPLRQKARAADRRLRILSAACASGEEAYSLAMLLRASAPGLEGWDLQIKGVDLNPSMLQRAVSAVYTPWSLRDTSAELRERYFEPAGRDFRVREEVRTRVQFERRNLSEANPDLWPEAHYDVVFCRNLIMYFTPEAAAALVARIARSLVPGGFLFLGHAETLRGLSQDFHLCHTHDTFYYQRPEPGAARVPSAAGPAPAAAAWTPAAWDDGSSWVQAIQRASDRIAGLAARSQDPAPRPLAAGAGAGAGAAPSDLERALELTRHERYGEALEALPEAQSAGVDAQLLRAVLLLNLGRLELAQAACAGLLASDELNAGAHYVMALCREHAGDLDAAAQEDRTAIYLDASFAMPWLHLGLMERRRGRADQARRNLEQALSLLAREDSSRVLLFGGGFGREGLAQLCRSGLAAKEAQHGS
jgi:chemotaxis protein methyltransferase CheR